MKATLVGQMVASSQALEMLGDALVSKGCDVVKSLGYGKELLEVSTSRLIGTDIFIVGMTSEERFALPEVACATLGRKLNTDVFFYADTFGVWNRPWFESVITELQGLATIFVLNEEEAGLAQAKFPSATVVATGNPCWDKFFFPTKTREMVRLTLGINNGERVMLCPWGKSKEVNILHGQKAIEVAGQTGVGLVTISPHPGDMTPLEDYYSVAKGAPVSVRFVTMNEMPCSDLIPGVDLVFESASTIGIEAVCQRVPVVDWFSDIALARLEKATGSRLWPLCEQGAALLYQNSDDLGLITSRIRGEDNDYRSRLEVLYPQPARKGIALEKMIEAIEKVAVLTH